MSYENMRKVIAGFLSIYTPIMYMAYYMSSDIITWERMISLPGSVVLIHATGFVGFLMVIIAYIGVLLIPLLWLYIPYLIWPKARYNFA